MAKAKKLPSGSWRCQVYDYTDREGKRHYKSFTVGTRKDAEFQAQKQRPIPSNNKGVPQDER